jgi:hypothetical protein
VSHWLVYGALAAASAAPGVMCIALYAAYGGTALLGMVVFSALAVACCLTAAYDDGRIAAAEAEAQAAAPPEIATQPAPVV